MSRAIQDEKNCKMRPELELVILSAREKSPESDARIRTLIAEGLNWNEVISFAHQHKVATVLRERVGDLEGSSLAPSQKERLIEVARNVAKNNLLFMGEMLSLHSFFSAAQIPAIPFKGPALAWLAYPNFAQRTCVDLDFVVPQRFILEAMALLQARGLTPQFSLAEAQAGQDGPTPGQYAFAPASTGKFVELHTERTLRYFSHPINLDEMGSRAISLEIGGQTLRSFSVEDLLVMLSVHGAKHFWERFSWIVDIAQLVTVREVNWTLLFAIGAKMGSTRLLRLGLYLAHEMVGAPLPQSVLESARGDTQVQWLARKVRERYAGTSDPSVGVWSRAIFRFQSCDSFLMGVRQLYRLSTSPTESDRQTFRLPGFLSPLYALVRPFRLLGKYGLGVNRRSKPDPGAGETTPPESQWNPERSVPLEHLENRKEKIRR